MVSSQDLYNMPFLKKVESVGGQIELSFDGSQISTCDLGGYLLPAAGVYRLPNDGNVLDVEQSIIAFFRENATRPSLLFKNSRKEILL